LTGQYLVIAVASSLPPILNPSALIQPRFAKSPIAIPALAIMNRTVWSFLPTLRFIADLQIIIDAGCELAVRYSNGLILTCGGDQQIRSDGFLQPSSGWRV
jgi:hypothetical protein